ncbi:Histone-lysine N-methyltransferase setd7 [Marasmius crinis-equi]|uniref:Histone-lysine N-methyltransferase setd7 n=1 Tax=Marasmius crinis-equi TaxID=585013 RepID=A0ABR3EZ25_9AGAR
MHGLVLITSSGEKQKRNAEHKRCKPCQNVQMMRGDSEPFEVKEGKYGAGAFAVRDMPKDTYIGEYVGELRTPNEAFQESFIQKYRDLNYSFALLEEPQAGSAQRNSWAGPIVDSHYMGNATRSLNHSSNPNCEAMSRFVNGEPRVGIKTRCAIKKGEELLMDYGEIYWAQNATDSSSIKP